MPLYVVLLRGINVRKAKRVPMAAFKETLLELGCTQVTTLLNSGNAVLKHSKTPSAALAAKIADALAVRFGFAVPVVVKSQAEFLAVVDGNTITVLQEDHSRLLVAFSQTPAALASLAPLAGQVEPPERFLPGSHAAYLLCARGILECKAAAALLGKRAQTVTTRNWATVLKLQALLGRENA